MSTFLILVLSVWTGMHLYAGFRVLATPPVGAVLPRLAFWALWTLLWASFMLARLLSSLKLDWLSHALEWVGAMWMGVLLLMVLCLLVADLGSGFGAFGARFALAARRGALAASALLSVIAVVQALHPPVVRSYEVRAPGLPAARDGLVLVEISDLHLGVLVSEGWLDRIVAQVQSLKPDLVVVGGDLVEGHGEDGERFLPALRRLSAPLGVWGVTGNHEFYAGLPWSERFFQDAGITLLRDRRVEVAPGVVLAGVDDLTARRQFSRQPPDLAAVIGPRDAGGIVLLSHSPWKADEAAAAGASLMLSGHTHNGQIWPFGYFVQLVYPLLGGRYEVGGAAVIVCRGTGVWGPRMRLWRPSEIVKVTLRAAPSAPPAAPAAPHESAPAPSAKGPEPGTFPVDDPSPRIGRGRG